MTNQPHLPGLEPPLDKVVNVASVPHRSPFRYPGGKTWLVPRIRRWLASRDERPAEFVEPFAGGAIVGLTAAFEGLAAHVTLAELDDQVAAVWQAVLAGDGEWLAQQILAFDLTCENVETLLGNEPQSTREKALQTIVKNRVNRGGILAPGAGRLKYGEGGKGIRSRWYPETLRTRILAIDDIRDRFTFIHGDGLHLLHQYARRRDAVFFVDPPYTAKGKKAGYRLYRHAELDHEALFDIVAGLAGDFLMTYENAEGIRQLAEAHHLDYQAVAMKNTHHARMTELLIGRDLRWLR